MRRWYSGIGIWLAHKAISVEFSLWCGSAYRKAGASFTITPARSRMPSEGFPMLVEALHLALAGLGIVAAMMFALWVVHLLMRNAAIVDVGWAAGLATLAIFFAAKGPGYPAR